MTDRTKLALCVLAVAALASAYAFAISQYKYPPVCPVYSDNPRW